jgi:hypothetical protein
MKDVTFKDLKNLKYGDQIILEKDPMSKLAGKVIREPYAYVTRFSWDSYMFKSNMGATMSIQDDETIKSFGVKLLEESDPEYDKEMAKDAQDMGNFLDSLESEFFQEQGIDK